MLQLTLCSPIFFEIIHNKIEKVAYKLLSAVDRKKALTQMYKGRIHLHFECFEITRQPTIVRW